MKVADPYMKMWQADSAACVSWRYSKFCVCVRVRVWLWQGSFQTPQTPMNGSLCVRNCGFVWSAVTFAHSFSHRCKLLCPSTSRSTHQQTHKIQHVPRWMLHYWNILWFTIELVISPAETSHPLLSWHGSLVTPNVINHRCSWWLTLTNKCVRPPDTRPWLNISTGFQTTVATRLTG